MEVWKDIPGYEGFYQASTLGRIKSLERLDSKGRRLKGRILKDGESSNGYRVVSLVRDGKQHSFTIHRLVAKLFLDRVDGKDYINHIDGDKNNNRVDNLEWCTKSENTNHAIRLGLFNHEHCIGVKHPNWRGGIIMFTKGGLPLLSFETSSDVEKWIRENTKYTKAVARAICSVCRGERLTSYGYTFRYTK